MPAADLDLTVDVAEPAIDDTDLASTGAAGTITYPPACPILPG